MKRTLKVFFVVVLVMAFQLPFVPTVEAASDWSYKVDKFSKAKGDYDDIIWDNNKKDFRLSGVTFEEDFKDYTTGNQFPNDDWGMNFTRSSNKRILISSLNSKHGNKQLLLAKDAHYNQNPQVVADFSPTRKGEVEFTVRPTRGLVRVGLMHTPLPLDDDSRDTTQFMVRFENVNGKEGIRIGTNLGGSNGNRTAVHFIEQDIDWGSWYDVKLVWDLDKKSGIDVYVNGKRKVKNFYSKMLKGKRGNFYFNSVQMAVGAGSPSIKGNTGHGYFDYIKFRDTGQNSGTFTSDPLKIPNGIAVNDDTQKITWRQGTSSNSSARVQTSVSSNGGKSWSKWKTVSRGNPVPGIPENKILNNYKVKYRVTLSRNSSSYHPWVRELQFNFENADIDKPEHISHGITNHNYKNGNDYWVKPNQPVKVRIRGKDDGLLIERATIRLRGSNNDGLTRSRYFIDDRRLDYYDTEPDIEIPSASLTYESSNKQTREVTFDVRAKTDGNHYNVYSWYTDNANNSRGWVDTGMNLKVDGTAPTFSLSRSTSSWTNGTVVLKVNNLSDSGSGYAKTILPNGNSTTSSNVSYTVSSNGTYTFKVYDKVGNVRTKSIKVDNIDKSKPTASLSQTPTSWTNGNVTLKLTNVKDTGGSGYYRTKLPNGNFTTSPTPSQTVTSNGSYTFVVYDRAGNHRSYTITVDNIDKSKPSVSFTPNGNSTYEKSHSTKVAVSDSGSGITTRQYSWTTNTNEPSTGWKDFLNNATIKTPSGTGNRYLWVKAIDEAGNKTVTRSNVFRIDNTNPSATFSLSDTGWSSTNIKIRVRNAKDSHSGYYRIKQPNGNYTTSSSFDYTVKANGTYTFVVYDKAGNHKTYNVKVEKMDLNAPILKIEEIGSTNNRIDVRLHYSD